MTTYKESLVLAQQEISSRLLVYEEIPDVKEGMTKAYKNLFFSPTVNARADKVWVHHDCTCCNDSVLFASPYILVGDNAAAQVFADPLEFPIGSRNISGSGDVERIGWQLELEKAGIQQLVIQQIQEYFNNHPPLPFLPRSNPVAEENLDDLE